MRCVSVLLCCGVSWPIATVAIAQQQTPPEPPPSSDEASDVPPEPPAPAGATEVPESLPPAAPYAQPESSQGGYLYAPPPGGHAEPAPFVGAAEGRTADEEHEGFLLRFTLGLGYTVADEANFDYLGAGLGWSLGIGGVIAGNFALNAEFFTASLFSPTFKIDGREEPDVLDLIQLFGFGGGATYYIMPINIYVSGAVGIGGASFQSTRRGFIEEDATDLGVAMNFMVGKEWWVGNDWGIGLAAQVVVGSFPSGLDGVDARFVSFTPGIMFSSTYN